MGAEEPEHQATMIELINVDVPPTFAADRTPVLMNVNWTVQRGHYWVLASPPGTGKTDLLMTAAGLVRPSAGNVRLFGQDVTELDEDELIEVRKKLGFVFADGGRIFQQMSVRDNLTLPLNYHCDWEEKETEERLLNILEFTELTRYTLQPAGRITRYLQQRVGLARALMMKPDILLLDNPLSGLDPRQIYWWLGKLSALSKGEPSLQNQRVTLVVSVNDLRPWTDQGTHFALLQTKTFVQIGNAKDLKESADPVVRDLLTTKFS
jgi:ABC-type transporter Mla maintaining outer membrane lipid asymmetry ATPase subunit MlaF